jgi:ferredoxin
VKFKASAKAITTLVVIAAADSFFYMPIAKLKVDRDLCIGAASCVAVYSDVFSLDGENKAVMPKKTGPTSDLTAISEMNVEKIDDETLLMAAQSCPTKAIFLYDETGKQVYPEV